MSYRILKVNQLLKREISAILEKKLSPIFGIVTVSEVKTAPDLKTAVVFISVIEKEKNKEVLEELENLRFEIQKELGKRISLKYTPSLSFKVDKKIEEGFRVEEILNQIQKEKEDGV